MARVVFSLRQLAASAPWCAAGTLYMAQAPTLEDELDKLRPFEAAMREHWMKDEEGFRKLPPRAWPPDQPKPEELSQLRAKLEVDRCPPASQRMSEACGKLTFDVATTLVFNSLEGTTGFEMYRNLGQNGYVDGMVGTGVCLVEGLAIQQQEREGIEWLNQAVEEGSAQAQVELGNLYYTGTDLIAEDEKKAVAFFEAAAAQKHVHAMFMLADCLLEGSGIEPNPARAVPLLYDAAGKGHRGARQHLRQLLDGDWRGFRSVCGDGPGIIPSSR